MHYLALILVSSITFSSTFLAVKQGWVGNSPKEKKAVQEVQAATDDRSSAFEALKKPLTFNPVKINIGEEDLYLEKLGLDTEGKLETPEKWENAGWYKKSAKPGEKGNIIVAGHYDDDKGDPAAFWGLKNLSVNDKVHLTDELNRTFTYNITETFYVETDDPNRLEIFDEDEVEELTIVTCGGLWNDFEGTYSKRLVVKAELVSGLH